MITQEVKTTLGSMVAEFSKGDVAIGVGKTNNNKVAITLSNIEEKQEIGSKVKNANCRNTPVIMTFDNVASVNVLKGAVEKCIEMLGKIEKRNRVFHVPYKNVYVTSAFRGTNPHPEKIMQCYNSFVKTGKIDREIEVTKNMVITDGYVGYLVAGFASVPEIDVVAPDGLEIKVGNQVIRFLSDEIEIAYNLVGEKDDEKKFCLIIKNGGKRYEIPAATPEVAIGHLQQIQKVFTPKYTLVGSSTLNIPIINYLQGGEVPFTHRAK